MGLFFKISKNLAALQGKFAILSIKTIGAAIKFPKADKGVVKTWNSAKPHLGSLKFYIEEELKERNRLKAEKKKRKKAMKKRKEASKAKCRAEKKEEKARREEEKAKQKEERAEKQQKEAEKDIQKSNEVIEKEITEDGDTVTTTSHSRKKERPLEAVKEAEEKAKTKEKIRSKKEEPENV